MRAGKPGSQPGHLHLSQDEQLEVKQGRLGYWRGHPSLAAEVAAEDEDAMVVIQQGGCAAAALAVDAVRGFCGA
jgi:hypothetical protein